MQATRKISREIIVLILIIALGFLIRLYFWAHYSDSLSWDEGAHSLAGVMLAQTILHGFNINFLQKFTANYWATMGSLFFYPYGYDIMSTISFLLFGFNQLSARLPSMFFSLLIIIAIYHLSKEMFDQKIGCLAALMAAINPYFIYWGGQALVDLPMTCLMVYSIYFCFKGIKTNRTSHWVLSGLFCGFAGLMKPHGLTVFPFLILLAVYYKGLKELFKRHFLILTATVFLISFTYFGFGLLARYILPKLKIINQEIGIHIFKDIFVWFGKPLYFTAYGAPSWKTLAGWLYYPRIIPMQIGGYLIVLFCLLGFLNLLFNKKLKKTFYPVLYYIIFTYFIFAIFNNKETRYTIPCLPFFCIFTAIGIKSLTATFKQKIALFISPIILIFLTISSFKQLTKFVDPRASKSNLSIAAKVITNSKPGLIVPFSENNSINVQTISFYIAINDPQLQYSVYWPEKLGQASYIISQEKINIPDTESIFSQDGLFVFKRTE